MVAIPLVPSASQVCTRQSCLFIWEWMSVRTQFSWHGPPRHLQRELLQTNGEVDSQNIYRCIWELLCGQLRFQAMMMGNWPKLPFEQSAMWILFVYSRLLIRNLFIYIKANEENAEERANGRLVSEVSAKEMLDWSSSTRLALANGLNLISTSSYGPLPNMLNK